MSNQTLTNRCPACGATIPDGAPQGLCPKCLLAGVGRTIDVSVQASEAHGPPPLADVAAAFPQLEIVDLIGMGGMGCVFKARQPKLERFVALKLLPTRFATDPSFRERFSREARVLARLNHPNIVSVFDFGEAGGFFYLLMEFVDGANLRQAMRAGRFTPDQALAIVPKICEALQFAHSEGILHRDVKPENILLDTKGRVKIADFGIAKLVGEPQPVTQLTATGAAIGTPQYMAPEQIEHPEAVDHRADIYSLGVVFYEMLTGELPIGRFAPPSKKTPMDPRVDEVVLRALEKEREKRYQSAGEVKTSVEHLTAPPNSPGASAPAPAFSPVEDFILCPPRLPRMAKAIIVYTLVVAPLMWVVGLFTFEALPKHDLAAFIEGAFNVLSTVGDFFLLVLLAIGGWKLRGLRPSAPGWLKVGLWLHLGFIVLALAGQIWVVMAVDELVPDAPMPSLDVSDGVMLALILAALVFEISALVWLHRHAVLLKSLCQPPSLGQGPHGTMVLGQDNAPDAGVVPQWSRVSIIGAVLAGVSVSLPVLVAALMMGNMGGIGLWEICLLLGAATLLGLPGTILGWVGLSNIHEQRGRSRGLPLAVIAALAWPLLLLVAATLVATPNLVPRSSTAVPALASLLWMVVPAGALTFSVWAVFAAARWGANQPPAERKGILKWIFATLLLALLGNAVARRLPSGPARRAGAPNVSEHAVAVQVSAPPRETLVVTGIVLSNGVPVNGRDLRAKLWPPRGRETSPFEVRWQTNEDTSPDGTPWEIVVEDRTSGTIAARLRPPGLPRLDWTASPSSASIGKLAATREAHTFEVARALQTASGGNAGAADWSVRLQLQSSPVPPPTSKRGIEADFVLPANQVATFELVTRSNGVIVPVPDLAAYQINGMPETYTGKFILAEDPDDLDSLSGLPRWKFGIIGPDGRLTSQGLAVPPIPADFSLSMDLWKALQTDQEVIEGLAGSGSGRPAYGLRIRTQTVKMKPGLRHSSSGFGTNWLKDAAQHLELATPDSSPWIRFTFTAVELRQVGGTNWLAVDYVDDVHGACSKAFPWELTLPGAQAEVRTTEFLKEYQGSPAVRHQRIEYKLPDSMKREQLDQLRVNVEKTLREKSIRLGLGEKSLLFGVSTTEGFSIKAWVEVKPPLPVSQ